MANEHDHESDPHGPLGLPADDGKRFPAEAVQTVGDYLKTRQGDKKAVAEACLTVQDWAVGLWAAHPDHPAIARGEHSAGATDAQRAAALERLAESHGDDAEGLTLPPWLLPLLLQVLQLLMAA